MKSNVVSFSKASIRNDLFKNCSLNDVYDMFLSEFNNNTRYEYKTAIDQFFDYAFGIDIGSDCFDTAMLASVTLFTAKKYYNALISGDVTGSEMSNATASKKIYALSAFWKVLTQYFGDIKGGAWQIGIKRESTPYDTFTADEIRKLVEWSWNRGKKGHVVSLWFETSFATGIRKTALCNLKWSEINHKTDRKTNTMVWIIDTVDKGGKMTNTPISDELYAKLREYGSKGEYVFNISSKTIDRAMSDFKNEVIHDSSRRLCVHSIKSASIDMAYAVSGGDLQMAKLQGHHSSSDTTERHYLGKGVPMVERPSYKYRPAF